MIVGGAPDKNETHVRDVAMGKETKSKREKEIFLTYHADSI